MTGRQRLHLITEGRVAGMKITRNKDMEGQFYLQVDARACIPEGYYFTAGRIGGFLPGQSNRFHANSMNRQHFSFSIRGLRLFFT